MKLKVIILMVLLTTLFLTSCKSSPEVDSSVAPVPESSIEEITQPEEQSPIAEITEPVSEQSAEQSSRKNFFDIDDESSVTAEDESSQSAEIIEYEYAENELHGGIEITKYNGTDTEVIIPDKINGLEVTVIGDNAFESNENITSVTIPNTILDIGIKAFSNCSNLTNVIFEDNSKLDRILVEAFEKTAIQEFTVPENCRILGGAFFGSKMKRFIILGKETQIGKTFAFSSLDVVVYFPRGSKAETEIKLHSPYNWKYLDELE